MRNLLYFITLLMLCVAAVVGGVTLYRDHHIVPALFLVGLCALGLVTALALYDKLESSGYTLKHHNNCVLQDALEVGATPEQFDQLIKGRASRNS